MAFGACKHKVSGSFSLPSRGPFHLSLTVLFSIGHWVVFRLGGWSPRLRAGFHVPRVTLDPAPFTQIFAYGTLTPCGMASHPFRLIFVKVITVLNPAGISTSGLASFHFARRYFGNHFCFLFLRLLRCFSSAGVPPYGYGFTIR